MSLSKNFPTVNPSLLLDFANTRALDPRITFTRASPGTYYDGQTVALAEQNLLLQSQSLAAGSWTVIGATLSDNVTTAPDATTTASRITEAATTGEHYTAQTLATFDGGVFTYSVFLRKGNLATAPDWVQLACGGTNSGYFSVNLATGAAGNTGGFASTAITNAGGGWYRVSVSSTIASGAISFRIGFTNNTNAAVRHPSYTGAITADVFAWGAQVENRATATAYTVTTTTLVTNYQPVLLTAPAGTARFDSNPVTSESLGLLIEEARTNLVLYSAEFDNAYWTKLGSTITASANVAPNGTVTASAMNFVSGTPQFFRLISKAASAITYTLSCYAKAYTASVFQVILSDNTTGQCTATFNLTTGVITGTTTGTWTSASSTITPVGNGWYRCSITGTSPANTGLLPTFTCPNPGSIFVWGAQLEVGGFATTYIATVATTQLREADFASIVGTNFGSWYNNIEGTFYCGFLQRQVVSADQYVFSANNGTASNQVHLRTFSTAIAGSITSNGTDVAPLINGTAVANASFETALAYKINDFAMSTNGLTPSTDVLGNLPAQVVNRIDIGNLLNTGFRNGTIYKIAYYPVRLTNAQLQTLTQT